MLEKLKELALRQEELEAQLSDPTVYADTGRLREIQRELKELGPVVEAWRAWKEARSRQSEAEALLHDPEMKALAQEELSEARRDLERLENELKILLLPRDPNDERNVILEIRSGAGGEEAAIFAGDLLRMYTMYAQRRGWQTEVVSLSRMEQGGVRECAVLIEGEGAYSRLKFESGVHQVKRVPVTESNGRIQTRTATVAVLPEASEVEVAIDPKDLQTDTYRSSGAGGQHVNKTESAVRLTHLPTGLVVTCQDERSQHKNREKALRVLQSRLYEREQEKQDAVQASERRNQVGGGYRSEKIRTYRFREGLAVDHRAGVSEARLAAVLDGDLDEMIDALTAADQAEKLKGGGDG